MELTSRGRYAVLAMCDLATEGQDRPVSLAEIAGRMGISVSYLEQLFARLRKAGLVRSVRGPGGGYFLTGAPAELRVAEVVGAVDGDGVGATESRGGAVKASPLWRAVNELTRRYLHAVTLDDVLSGQLPAAELTIVPKRKKAHMAAD
jgi:Rrf2 family transcriptional regulator, iron-sulfur cluster assembly transcription factor